MAKIKPKFTGEVNNGKLTLHDREAFKSYYSGMEGKVMLTIEKHRNIRSNNQNSYYWGVVLKILGDEFGYTPQEMHEALKFRLLRSGRDDLPTIKSTASLTTSEFKTYIDNIKIWASRDYNTYIPDPDEIALPE